jgi:hypothetical protein
MLLGGGIALLGLPLTTLLVRNRPDTLSFMKTTHLLV